MGYILTGDEKIDGEPDLDIELRRESLCLHGPRDEQHTFAYSLTMGQYGGPVTTIEVTYPLLRQIVRWATSPQGRRLLTERGVEVDW